MSEYLFLYRGGSRPTSPQDAQAVMQQWMTWLQDLAKRGHVKDQGQPLEPGGKVVTGREQTITDGRSWKPRIWWVAIRSSTRRAWMRRRS
jgi:hypothetical protein